MVETSPSPRSAQMAQHEQYDAVVIGGGPAGLQATLTLARVHRTVLMVDSGSYRNDPAAHMHNVVTHDGTPPAEFRAAARKELAAYDTVTVREDAVTSVARGRRRLRRLARRRAGPHPRGGARDRCGRHPAGQARARGAVRVRGGALPVLPRPRVRRPARRHPRRRGGRSPARAGRADRLAGHRVHRRRGAHRRAARGRRGPHRPGDRRLPQPASARRSASTTDRPRTSRDCSSRPR